MRKTIDNTIIDPERGTVRMTAWEHNGHLVEITITDNGYDARIDEGIPIIEKDFMTMAEWLINELKLTQSQLPPV